MKTIIDSHNLTMFTLAVFLLSFRIFSFSFSVMLYFF